MKEYKVSLLQKQSVGDYYIFDFKKPVDLVFKEGQYGIFMHVNKQIIGRKMRAFSMASSMEEDVLRIATKIVKKPSDFKKKMLELSLGDVMSYTGPTGDFTLETSADAVCIAGGIGITPIRSMLHLIDGTALKMNVTLIYSEADGVFTFKDEFDEMTLHAYYQETVEKTREVIQRVVKKKQNDAFYYVAGSVGFVSGIQNLLIDEGVTKDRIKFDRFNGYATILKMDV